MSHLIGWKIDINDNEILKERNKWGEISLVEEGKWQWNLFKFQSYFSLICD